MSRHEKFSSIGVDLTQDIYRGRLYKTNRPIKHVSIHQSASPQNRGDDVHTIDRWHIERWGSGVGYHFVILEDGTIQKGRWLDYQPAAVSGHNTGNIAICYIGNSAPTVKQNESMMILSKILIKQYKLDRKAVKGHNEFSRHHSRGCPGDMDMDRFRESTYS